LVKFAHDKNEEQTYFTGNLDIFDQAQRLAHELGISALALAVWNGDARGPDGVTGHFKQQAAARGWVVEEILTV